MCSCDVGKEADLARAFEQIPSLDVLVLNAGVESFAQVQDITEQEYARVMDVNLKGVILAAKYGAKKMLSRGGAIVTVSSVWGEKGGSCESVYSASKGAVIAFSKALAKELAPSNIRVNCVVPGVIDTTMNARLLEEERRALEEEIPLGRMGKAEEVASAILFLLQNEYMTGETLSVGGGFCL